MEIDYDKVEYVTNRRLTNKAGEETGHIKMYSYDNNNFHYYLHCPYCGEEQEDDIQLEKRPFYIPCRHCERKSLVEKLTNKVKKEAKA